MGRTRILLATLIFTALPAPVAAAAQSRDAAAVDRRTDELPPAFPLLEEGEWVRVWPWYEPRIVGRLTAYAPPDSVAVRRTALVLAPWEERRANLLWGEIRRLDRADGRAILEGAGRGVAAALGAGLMGAFLCESFGGADCSVVEFGAKAAVFTIPIGVVWGFLSTDWDRVYEAHPSARPPVVLS